MTPPLSQNPCYGKIGYKSRKKAEAVRVIYTRDRESYYRVYKCSNCAFYHLTTHRNDDKNSHLRQSLERDGFITSE